MKLGVLTSHRGSNLQAIMDACQSGTINGEVVVVISNNSQSQALARARASGIPTCHLSSKTHPIDDELDGAIKQALQTHGTELVLTLGFMKKLGPQTLAAYRQRILNIHPALLPAFGGQGMYGERVHQAVLDAGHTVTGATIHHVDGEYDTGPTVRQAEVAVRPDDDVASLAARVLATEHTLLVETLADISHGRLTLDQAEQSTYST